MSKRLTGLNPLAYIGVEAAQPSNTLMSDFPPTSTDSKNVNIGDFWVDTSANNLYVLVSLAAGVATWILVEAAPGGPSINQIDTDAGTVLPVANIVNIDGGQNIVTSGTGNTLTIDVAGTIDHALLVGNALGAINSLAVANDGEIPIGSTGVDPVISTITAGAGISIVNGPGSITVSSSGSVASTYTADAGTATPSGNNINIFGDGSSISTSASGSTITISAEGNIPTTFDGDSGSATPAANILRILGGTGIMTAASGNTVVITNTGGGGGGAGSMTLIGSATASSQTSVTFTSGINSDFNNYILYFDSIEATSTGVAFYLQTQISTDGGATYINTGYLNATAASTSGLIAAQYLTTNMGGTEVVSGFQNLLDMTANAANHFPASQANFMVWDGAAASTSGTDFTGIYPTAPTAVDAFKVVLTNGAAFSGTFYLYGLSNTGGSSGGGAVSFIQTQNASAQTTLDFTTGITPSINDYLLLFESVEFATTGADLFLQVQISTNGGSTWINTGYVNNAAGTSALDLAIVQAALAGPTAVVTGESWLQDLTAGGAADYPTAVSNANSWDFTAGNSIGNQLSGLHNAASTVVNAIRIKLSNNATFSGKFSLYGYSSSSSGGATGTQNFITDSGTATQVGGNIMVVGAGGITTSGSGNTVTITGSGAGITWSTVTAATQALVAQNGYVINRATAVTLTLPVTAAVGDTFYITGLGAGGWIIAQNGGQQIHFGASATTVGAGGSLASTNRYNTITLVCSVTNTTFNVLASIGNITVV